MQASHPSRKPEVPIDRLTTSEYDAELAHEQQYVDVCYARLEELRLRAKSTLEESESRATSTPQSVFEREVFASYSRKRLAAVSASEHQLVFGRLDTQSEPEPVYVGRIGMSDDTQRRILVDWRAPVGSDFYQATATQPRGVIRRRTLITRLRKVVDLNDDLFSPDLATDLTVVVGEGALLHALVKERGRYMQDIVATIQAGQDEVIRCDPKANVVLTGGPGTGKSVVALHRTAYLMYQRAAEMERRGVLVVGPGRRFSRYISQVLPSLGETSVSIRSVYDLVDGVVAEGREPLHVARLKGSSTMARALKDFVIASYPDAPDRLSLTRAGQLIVLRAPDLARIRHQTLSAAGGDFNTAGMQIVRSLARLLAHKVQGPRVNNSEIKSLARELADDTRVVDAIEVLLPYREPLDVLTELRKNPEMSFRSLRKHLGAPGARAVADQLASAPRVCVGDIPLVDELDRLLGPATAPKRARRDAVQPESVEARLGLAAESAPPTTDFGHIVVDEAQDLTPMQWRMIARRGTRATWTVVGDPMQATLSTPDELEEAINRSITGGRTERFTLAVNYRTPEPIMSYASRASGLDLGELRSVRTGDAPVVFNFDHSPAGTLRQAARWLAEQPGSGCFVVAAREDVDEVTEAVDGADVLWALDAKGLEFDSVVLYRPEALDTTNPADASLVLIGATRATKRLAVVTGPPPKRVTGRLF